MELAYTIFAGRKYNNELFPGIAEFTGIACNFAFQFERYPT